MYYKLVVASIQYGLLDADSGSQCSNQLLEKVAMMIKDIRSITINKSLSH